MFILELDSALKKEIDRIGFDYAATVFTVSGCYEVLKRKHKILDSVQYEGIVFFIDEKGFWVFNGMDTYLLKEGSFLMRAFGQYIFITDDKDRLYKYDAGENKFYPYVFNNIMIELNHIKSLLMRKRTE